jgi:dephospho-CoA kinase
MKKQKVVVGVAGMPGAGKATIKITAENMGYSTVVMGDEVREETKRRGLEPTPENIGKTMIKLRQEEGPASIAKRCLDKIENARSRIVFVDGVRSLEEADEFKRNFTDLILIAVHSSPENRFQRLSKRKRSDDPEGWNLFQKRDLRELSVGQGDAIALADYMIVNDGTYNEFKIKVDEVVKKVIHEWTKPRFKFKPT